MNQHNIEDLLERIWFAREEGEQLVPGSAVATRRGLRPEAVTLLVEKGYASVSSDQIGLTPAGETEARTMVRRHRLAEELLSEVFMVEGKEVVVAACGVEHYLSPVVTDRICTLLGHPTVCPHGRPIPPGPCCSRHDMQVQPLVERLTELPVGAEARIVFMSPDKEKRIERLMALGMVPGTRVRLQQKRPAYVVVVGETTVAVDEEILSEVYVRTPNHSG